MILFMCMVFFVLIILKKNVILKVINKESEGELWVLISIRQTKDISRQ